MWQVSLGILRGSKLLASYRLNFFLVSPWCQYKTGTKEGLDFVVQEKEILRSGCSS